ncbi:MAG TPA: ATP-dependent helicase, partial [Streptosporangiaceae bacterium]|nr:ATP-dependent helicase [Streptosporangiaceae bacterium]
LNDEQRRAATHADGPLLVLAGAGTGKTGTLVARAAWLRAQGVEASRILLLTFTRRAADDMLARVVSRAAAGGAAGAGGNSVRSPDERICGGTFHAIAHRIIRAHAESFSLPPAFSVIDPADVADVLDSLRTDHGLVGTERRAPRAAVCADIYTRCVNTQTTVADVVASGFPWCRDFTGQLAGLFRAYVAHKRAHGLVDFDDLLLLWRAALADPAAGPALRGLFDAVLVDEYQDVNAVQAEIVRLLRPDGRGLTCVGDDAQAIYAFRGADPGHLRALAGAYPGLSVIRLVRNYRSRDSVLRLANAVRPQSEGLELELTGLRGPGPAPQLVRCHDEATQAREITARVLDAHESGRALRDQAVLVRAAHHSDVLEIELSARGIPFVKYGGLRFTEAAHVKDFLAAARVVTNPADDLGWFRVLRLHEGIGASRARRVVDALRLADPAPLERWPAAAELIPARAREAVSATVAGLIAAAALDAAADRAVAILAALVDPLRARYPDAGARLADLERLADAAASRPSLHEALVELALDPPASGSDLAGPPRLDDDYLVISTVHSAKGLEWPVVHLPHLVDGAVPSDMALSSPEGLAEERRLFYVAVTRARDELYLYAPLRLHYHRTGRDDRHGYAQISRFLDARAQAQCEIVEAAPRPPAVPRMARLAATVEAQLESLWSG